MHCPECGFANAEGANYCQKCGAFQASAASSEGDTTAAYELDETGELRPVDIEKVSGEGATLAIRSGGGRAGEVFAVFLTLLTESWVANVSLYIGLGMTLAATAIYVQAGIRFSRARKEPRGAQASSST